MICANCQNPLPDFGDFCPACGHRAERVVPGEEPSVQTRRNTSPGQKTAILVSCFLLLACAVALVFGRVESGRLDQAYAALESEQKTLIDAGQVLQKDLDAVQQRQHTLAFELQQSTGAISTLKETLDAAQADVDTLQFLKSRVVIVSPGVTKETDIYHELGCLSVNVSQSFFRNKETLRDVKPCPHCHKN